MGERYEGECGETVEEWEDGVDEAELLVAEEGVGAEGREDDAGGEAGCTRVTTFVDAVDGEWEHRHHREWKSLAEVEVERVGPVEEGDGVDDVLDEERVGSKCGDAVERRVHGKAYTRSHHASWDERKVRSQELSVA